MNGVRQIGHAAARRFLSLGLLAGVLFSGCATARGPSEVASLYAQAVYARDFRQAHSLLSAEDRRATIDSETFARQYGQAEGFALDVGRRLAASAKAAPGDTRIGAGTAEVRIRMRYPDADHPDLFDLLLGRHALLLNARSEAERTKILGHLDDFLRGGTFPVHDRQETFSLVREGSDWKITRGYALKGVHIHFRIALAEGLPIEVGVFPREAVVMPGEAFFVDLVVRNLAGLRVVARMDHEILPKDQEPHLSLVDCASLVFLRPGETERQSSEYLLVSTIPGGTRRLDVVYRFTPVQELGRGEEGRP
ncbi:MAG: hypothetical protein AABY65_08345 [Nitrospirota bacterium]